jgi:hypothetical protein
MVGGLDKFKEHFGAFPDQYILIGGTACDLLHGALGLSFRPTKDFDVVLCIEALDQGFFKSFRDFVRIGGYRIKEKDSKRCLYRFDKPTDPTFPKQIELFSRKPDLIEAPADAILTPIPAGEGASNLSAILMDDDGYRFLLEGTVTIEGVRVATAERLIPLKAQAWTDLAARKAQGEHVDSKDLEKHRKDIYLLSRLLVVGSRVAVPAAMAESLRFWQREGVRNPLDSGSPGLGGLSVDDVHALIHSVFQL